MSVGELRRLLEPLTDDAEVLAWDEHAQKWIPAKAKIATKGLSAVLAVEPMSWIERGGDR